jgi:hypothetical protein
MVSTDLTFLLLFWSSKTVEEDNMNKYPTKQKQYTKDTKSLQVEKM